MSCIDVFHRRVYKLAHVETMLFNPIVMKMDTSPFMQIKALHMFQSMPKFHVWNSLSKWEPLPLKPMDSLIGMWRNSNEVFFIESMISHSSVMSCILPCQLVLIDGMVHCSEDQENKLKNLPKLSCGFKKV